MRYKDISAEEFKSIREENPDATVPAVLLERLDSYLYNHLRVLG